MTLKNILLFLGIGFILTRSQRKNKVMLSKNFSLDEMTKSQTANKLGISNIPDPIAVSNLQMLVNNVLQPLRDAMNYPITVTSGYRSKILNEKISGAKNSQHMEGKAADIVGMNNAQMFNYIKDHLPFDQLIWEAGDNFNPEWIHVSYNQAFNRKEVLRYIPGQGYSSF